MTLTIQSFKNCLKKGDACLRDDFTIKSSDSCWQVSRCLQMLLATSDSFFNNVSKSVIYFLLSTFYLKNVQPVRNARKL